MSSSRLLKSKRRTFIVSQISRSVKRPELVAVTKKISILTNIACIL